MKRKGQNWTARLFIGALVVVSLVLAVVQYRWIGEVAEAERDRLRASLRTSLTRLSQDFSNEVTAAAAAVMPEPGGTTDDVLGEYAARYKNLRENGHFGGVFRTVAVAVPARNGVQLFRFENDGFVPSPWPDNWAELRKELIARVEQTQLRLRFGFRPMSNPLMFEVPYMVMDRERGFREREWLIAVLDADYIRTVMLPEFLKRYVGEDYDAEVTIPDDPSRVLVRTGPKIGSSADLSVRLFEPRIDQILRRAGIFRGHSRPPEGSPPDRGRWLLSVRHRGGSLEAVVQSGRMRNIAVFTVLVALLVAAIAALVRYTRRAQRLADLQMEFVASVSHELRTPLSVMKTAGHNLQGRVATDPTRVKTYGALVEEQAGKLAAIVDQVLSFANANAGRVIAARVPLEVAGIIQEALEGPLARVEQHLAENLPLIAGDPTTLRHAIRNLVDNAVKYGRESVRVIAAQTGDVVEIKVEDHGPGIPKDELPHVFDPFYRGKKAIDEQIHGTGLGLCLTKRIVEAHHGSIRVHSTPGEGTQFVVRLPVMRPETV